MRVTEDSWLVLAIAVVWLAIALLYQLLPVLDMPPGQRVWGVSALLMLALAAASIAADTTDTG